MSGSFVHVRNSAGGPVVSFTHDEWGAFLAGVRAGEFDLPDEETTP